MSTSTTLRRLADTLLTDNGGLEKYVRERRKAGRSWRLITVDLHDEIKVDVAYETLRGWFGDRDWAQDGRREQHRSASAKGGDRRPISTAVQHWPADCDAVSPARRSRREAREPAPE